MAAYLTTNPPVRDQWYSSRNRPLTGCTVLHTAESIMDTVGPDTGAENVANFIRTRTTPGSYHDLVDSDTALHLVEYRHGAYHDGTGSNNWALSLSFACATSDWPRMSPERRKAFLRQGAIAFLRQQAWRKANGAPLTQLRLISKTQSDAGVSGFTYHGYRDPGRRSDPGVAPPNLFPFNEFIATIKEMQGGATEEEDMPSAEEVAKAVLNTKLAVNIVDERDNQEIRGATVRDVLELIAFQLSAGRAGFRHEGPLRRDAADAARLDDDGAPPVP